MNSPLYRSANKSGFYSAAMGNEDRAGDVGNPQLVLYFWRDREISGAP